MTEKDGPFPFDIEHDFQLEPIMQVIDVQLLELKLNKVGVLVNATGHTRTIVWRFPELRPRPTPTKQGIYEFDFIGDASRALLDAVGTVHASYVFENRPVDFRGVRIFAKLNNLTKLSESVVLDVLNNLEAA